MALYSPVGGVGYSPAPAGAGLYTPLTSQPVSRSVGGGAGGSWSGSPQTENITNPKPSYLQTDKDIRPEKTIEPKDLRTTEQKMETGDLRGLFSPVSQQPVLSQAQETQQRQSIFPQMERPVNLRGNEYVISEASKAATTFGESTYRALQPILLPAVSLFPKPVREAAPGVVGAVAGGATYGYLITSPIGFGEVMSKGTFGTPEQRTKAITEVATVSAFGAISSPIIGVSARTIPARSVETTGYIGGMSVKPTQDVSQTFRVSADEAGFKMRTTTTTEYKDVVSIGGRTDTYTYGGERLATTQTPFSSQTGRFLVTEKISEQTIGSATRITAGREAIPIENVPQRALQSRDVTLFTHVPESGIFTPSYITKMSSSKTQSGVEISFSRGKTPIGMSLTTQEGAQYSTGITQKGQQIFAFDELGRVMGTSEIRIGVRETQTTTFKPEFKTVPEGSFFGVEISKQMPPRAITAKPQPTPASKPTEYTPYSIRPSDGAQAQAQYQITRYDKPVSLKEISEGLGVSRSISAQPPRAEVRVSGIELAKFVPANMFSQYSPSFQRQPSKQKQEQPIFQATLPTQGQFISITPTQKTTPPIPIQTPTITGKIILTPFQPQTPGITTIPKNIPTPTFPIGGTSTPTFEPPFRELEPPRKPLVPEFNIGAIGIREEKPLGGKYKRKKGKYQPSFTAVQFNIRGKISKGLAETGLAIRPIRGR